MDTIENWLQQIDLKEEEAIQTELKDGDTDAN